MRDPLSALASARTREPLLTAGLLLVLVIICANSWFALRSIQVLNESEYWVAHTWEVIQQLERVISSAKDAETGSRGFLLTGDDTYLEPYTQARHDLPAAIDQAQQLTIDNPVQQRNITELRAVTESRLQLLEDGIEGKRSGDATPLQLMVLSGTGKAEMDHMRQLIDAMQSEEKSLLQQRTSRSSTARRQAIWTVLFASIFDVAMIGLAFWLLTRERGLRQRADLAAERLEKLQSISDTGLNRLDSSELTTALTGRLRAVLQADGVVICNWHDGEIEVVHGDGVPVRPGRKVRLDPAGPLYRAGSEKRLVVAQGAESKAIPLTGLSANMAAVLVAPVIVAGEVRALLLAGTHKTGFFTSQDEQLLVLAADRIGLAIDRARAYEAERTAREQAEALAAEVTTLNSELEDRVRVRTAELEATNRELEAFSYSVSHDLRAPLRSVDGFSLALEEDFLESLNEEGRDFIRRIRTGVQRMGQLIDSLLQLSRITRAEISREDFSLSELADDVARELASQNSERSLDFHIQPGMDVNADPRLLRVALENLIGNAVKFTARKPEAVIEVGYFPESDEYYVRDNGAGFDMQYANKLFVAFQRLHGDKDFKGSGIGLATVARVIRRHHGSMRAEAQLNEGATFCFTLR
ncbi:CHASE3 domain-containing protein [Silvibacterium sp.]|uniref:sensor histidine kinase n=1 Tax=Silvibacterium sp. TaxID=1964179 RepID=UPI0039E35E3F